MITAETVSSIRTFDTGGLPVVSLYARVDPGPDGQREVRTRVSSLLDGIRPLAKDGIAEREWRMSLRGDINRMGGLATLGLGSCLWAGTVGAIQTLLVREGAAAADVVCDQSGWLALPGEVCPLCGNRTRRTPDVIDELAQVVINEGGAIHHVNSGSARLLDHDTGADLRFPLPEPPADS
jgi:hypothetical protein